MLYILLGALLPGHTLARAMIKLAAAIIRSTLQHPHLFALGPCLRQQQQAVTAALAACAQQRSSGSWAAGHSRRGVAILSSSQGAQQWQQHCSYASQAGPGSSAADSQGSEQHLGADESICQAHALQQAAGSWSQLESSSSGRHNQLLGRASQAPAATQPAAAAEPAAAGAQPAGPAGTSWADLGLPPQLIASLEQLSMPQPTLVQLAALQPVLQGRNAVIQSPTGTGKTLAYLLPLLMRLRPWEVGRFKRGAQVLIVSPTQDLAMQILRVARSLLPECKDSMKPLVGGPSLVKQLQLLHRTKPGLVSATPGRLLQAARAQGLFNKVLDVRGPRLVLVVEEADKLMAMADFHEAIQQLSLISRFFPCDGAPAGEHQKPPPMQVVLRHFQVILVSASINPAIIRSIPAWADTHPATIMSSAPRPASAAPAGTGEARQQSEPDKSTSAVNSGPDISPQTQPREMLPRHLQHQLMIYHTQSVVPLLSRVLRAYLAQGLKVLVFGGDMQAMSDIHSELVKRRCGVALLHGKMTGPDRATLLRRFNAGELRVLMLTDAFALGLDFQGADIVIQVENTAASLKQYVHRAGRAGRNGQPGTVLTLIPERRRERHLKQLRPLQIAVQEMEAQWSEAGGPPVVVPRPRVSHNPGGRPAPKRA